MVLYSWGGRTEIPRHVINLLKIGKAYHHLLTATQLYSISTSFYFLHEFLSDFLMSSMTVQVQMIQMISPCTLQPG